MFQPDYWDTKRIESHPHLQETTQRRVRVGTQEQAAHSEEGLIWWQQVGDRKVKAGKIEGKDWEKTRSKPMVTMVKQLDSAQFLSDLMISETKFTLNIKKRDDSAY